MSGPTHPRIDAYLDGELASRETACVEAHLSACAECRQAVTAARTLAAALVEPLPLVPASFVVATREGALRHRLPEAPLWWLALPVAWRVGLAAGLLFAALGGVRLGNAIASDNIAAAQLAAAFDTPAINAMLATSAPEEPR